VTSKQSFSAVIQNAGGGGGFVEIPFDVKQAFGSKRPKIRASIEDKPYRGMLVRMGGPRHMLIILKGIREKIGKTFGDTVTVTVEPDLQPRIVRLPPDLRKELNKNRAAAAAFQKLSYTRRKEYARWIEEARRPETRRERLAKTIAELKKAARPA
jgi:hypothetical protein